MYVSKHLHYKKNYLAFTLKDSNNIDNYITIILKLEFSIIIFYVICSLRINEIKDEVKINKGVSAAGR